MAGKSSTIVQIPYASPQNGFPAVGNISGTSNICSIPGSMPITRPLLAITAAMCLSVPQLTTLLFLDKVISSAA